MPDADISVDFKQELRKQQSISVNDLSAAELLQTLSLFDPYGLWCLDIETGMVEWSEDVYRIHGMQPNGHSVDVGEAIAKYHPDDRDYVARLIEETIEHQSGFRFVLRLQTKYETYKLVKSTGKFRTSADGKQQIVGTFSEFQAAKRSVGAVA